MRLLLALLLALPLIAQIRTYRTGMDVRGSVDMRNATASWPFRSVGSAPSGACTNAAEWVQYTTTGDLYRCVSGTWAIFAPTPTITWGSIGGTLSAQADISAALALKAPLASPTFTGSVNLPTPATNDNSTLGATTAWVRAQNYLTAAPVTTVFGRSGAVVATAGDYAASQVTNAVDSTASYSNPIWLTGLDWSKISSAPSFLTGNQTITLSGDASGSGATSIAATITGLNGVSLAGLGTGILKNTTGTGAPSIAVAADFPTLNQSTTGNAATATALAANPADCSTRQFATTIAANGDLACSVDPVVLSWTINGGGSVVTAATGPIRYVRDACTINLAMLDADQSGSLTVTIERAAYTTGTPSWSTISSGFALSSARSLKDSTLSGWTTSVAADSLVRASVTGTPATITYATVELRCL